MRKAIYIYFYIIYFLSLQCIGQSLHVMSTRFIGGATSCYSLASYAIPTRDKGILFTGLTDCVSSGDIPAYNSAIPAAQGNDVLIGKYDSAGNISWIKLFGGHGDDGAFQVCQTKDGGYAVLCGTTSNDGDVTGYHGGNGDLWLIRIDSAGHLLWEKCFGSPTSQTLPISLAITPDNGFILLGSDNGAGGDIPFQYSSSSFVFDWILIKTDSIGNKQWAKTLGGTDDEYSAGAILSVNNGYYLIGTSASKDYDCSDTSWHPGVNTHYDFHILRLDSAGNKLWDSSYGGSGYETVYSAIWDGRDSSLVLAGATASNDYMVSNYHGGDSDYWIIKANQYGKLLWAKTLGSGADDEAHSIMPIDVNKGYLVNGNTVFGPIGKENGWLFALDSAGNTMTDKVYGGTQYDYGYAVAPYKNGFAAVGGSTSPLFTEGNNIGKNTPSEDVYISYLEYWPTEVTSPSLSKGEESVYPNPFNLTLSLYLQGEGTAGVCDVMGRLVYVGEAHKGNTIIDTRSFAKGVYFLQVIYKDGSKEVVKVVRE